jgi:hypothetical protein
MSLKHFLADMFLYRNQVSLPPRVRKTQFKIGQRTELIRNKVSYTLMGTVEAIRVLFWANATPQTESTPDFAPGRSAL